MGEACPEARGGSLEEGQGPGNSGTRVCPMVCGAASWALWWAGSCPEEAVGSGGLKAACLLMGDVSPPS